MNAPMPLARELKEFRRLSPERQLSALRGLKLERTFQVNRDGIDEDARTAWFSIASDQPYERWWGVEILDMNSKSIRTERLDSGANFLVGHDPDDVVGVIEDWEISSGRKLRILVRFGRSARALEIFQDVVDGIRRNTSVGYIIHDLVLEKSEEGVNTYRVIDWEFLEGSSVSVPADPTVGLGRNLQGQSAMKTEALEDEPHQTRSQRRRAAAEDLDAHERITGILAAGDAFSDLGGREIARELVKDPHATVEMFKARMADAMRGRHRPTHTAEPAFISEADFDDMDSRSAFGEGARHILTKSKVFQGERAQESAFRVGQWLRGQLFGAEDARRWCNDHGLQIRAMSEAVNTAGGYLVPTEMASVIIDLADTFGAYRRNAVVWPMKSDTLSVPRSATDPTASFVGENSQIQESEASYGNVNLTAKKVAALVRMSTELMDDAPISVADDVAMKIARAFANKEDLCGFLGDGGAAYGGMQGLFTMLADGTHNAGAIDAASGHDTFAEIDSVDLSNLIGALPEYALDGAKWYCSGKAYALVFMRLMLAAGGNAASDIAGQFKRAYGGYPIVTSPVLPSAITALNGQVMIAFGNLEKSSKMGLRRDIRLLTLNERYAEFDQIGIQATERFHIVNHDLGSNTVAGPIVGLKGKT